MNGAAAPSGARSIYFVNAPVDVALIGGISIVAFLLTVVLGDVVNRLPLVTIAAWLVWVCNWPHFAASSYRLYRSRSTMAQYPVTAIVIPILIVGAVVASFSEPLRVAPYFVKLFYIWAPYHFAAQSLGVTLLYANRAGFRIGPWGYNLLAGFLLSTFVYFAADAEVGLEGSVYAGITVPNLALSAWVATLAEIGVLGSGVALGAYMTVRCVKAGRMVPPIVLLPIVTQAIWLYLAADMPQFYLFVPFFHSLQYLLIAWALQLKEKMDEGGIGPSRKYVVSESARWGAINVGVGALLFWVVPMLASSWEPHPGYAVAIIAIAIQMHHFFVDGVIWKLRNPKVSSVLKASLGDALGPAAAGETS